VLRKFNKTLIDVDGHTDSTGSASHNQGLSERRAASVANYLAGRGIDQRRISTMGYGMERPVASNASEAGRAQNRRVEISIAPIKQG
jgi:outer membrane protein OmpA-like peptidoglycan-associated protein